MYKLKKILKKLIIMLVKGIGINGKKNVREGKDCLEKNKLVVFILK